MEHIKSLIEIIELSENLPTDCSYFNIDCSSIECKTCPFNHINNFKNLGEELNELLKEK